MEPSPNALEILERFYDPDSKTFEILVDHSRDVGRKAMEIADRVSHLEPDPNLIQEAAMLHDIGIFMTNTPPFDCFGDHPYICHGYLGRELLEKHLGEAFHPHALICERHVGVGISENDIRRHRLPLPQRDMIPRTLEEKIICLADKFFSKYTTDGDRNRSREKPLDQVESEAKRHGPEKLIAFQELLEDLKL